RAVGGGRGASGGPPTGTRAGGWGRGRRAGGGAGRGWGGGEGGGTSHSRQRHPIARGAAPRGRRQGRALRSAGADRRATVTAGRGRGSARRRARPLVARGPVDRGARPGRAWRPRATRAGDSAAESPWLRHVP